MIVENDIRRLHRQAMTQTDLAFEAQREGFPDRAQLLFREAYKLEVAAADLVADDLLSEPARSVLHRSAATLALDCGEVREAERLAARGLIGNPPTDIAEELREVLDQARFERHLELRGIVLEPDEFQFVIDGAAVAPGMALLDEVIDRLRDVEKLVLRTAQRIRSMPFIERLRADIEIYITPPRPASFAVSVKVGKPLQPPLPGMEAYVYDFSASVVGEFMECIRLINSNDETALQSRFSKEDPAYYQNFMALTQKIAPDGTNINLVGFTSMRHNEEQRVFLTRSRSQIQIPLPLPPKDTTESGKTSIITGTLRFADEVSSTNKIKLVREKGRPLTITVPAGIMGDIVTPLWGKTVRATYTKYGRGPNILRDIEETEATEDRPSIEGTLFEGSS